jgi:hypothetical protein
MAGDFERIFAEKTRIVLRYPDRMSPIDLITLPLMIEQLQIAHPDCALHIRSVQDDGCGATVEITVNDIANRDDDTFEDEVARLQTELRYLQGQCYVYREQLMPLFEAMILSSRQITIGHFSSSTSIEGPMSRDTYKIEGPVGAAGPNAHAHDMTFQQLLSKSGFDLPRLAQELAQLRSVMKAEAEGTTEQDEAIGAVAAAEKAAGRGDGTAALQRLKAAGKWSLGIAEKIGVSVATEAIKAAMGHHGSPPI